MWKISQPRQRAEDVNLTFLFSLNFLVSKSVYYTKHVVSSLKITLLDFQVVGVYCLYENEGSLRKLTVLQLPFLLCLLYHCKSFAQNL